MRQQWHNRQLVSLTAHPICKVDITFWLMEYAVSIFNQLQTSTLPANLSPPLLNGGGKVTLFKAYFLIILFTGYFFIQNLLFPRKEATQIWHNLVTKFSVPFPFLIKSFRAECSPTSGWRNEGGKDECWDWICFAMRQPPSCCPVPAHITEGCTRCVSPLVIYSWNTNSVLMLSLRLRDFVSSSSCNYSKTTTDLCEETLYSACMLGHIIYSSGSSWGPRITLLLFSARWCFMHKFITKPHY